MLAPKRSLILRTAPIYNTVESFTRVRKHVVNYKLVSHLVVW